MRMWMIKPELLCSQHLLGEHFEIHKAVGNMQNSGKWARALTERGFLEPQNFLRRHDKLVEEMRKRGMKHQSPLKTAEFNIMGKVDKNLSINDLIKRCKNCKEKIKNDR